ncbi:MAG: hypothetical protein P8K79_08090 [Mariniblastus sp.]|nr:hypothetical protein [Mariniblastus sp.]
MKRLQSLSVVITLLATVSAGAQDIQNKRDAAVVADKEQLNQDELWIYDNLETAREQAARSNKPLMIVFR